MVLLPLACSAVFFGEGFSIPEGHEARIFFSLEKRRHWEDLIAAFQYLKRAYKKDVDSLFITAYCYRTRGDSLKRELD